MSDYHIPVLKNEALEILNVKPDNWYIDCNLGGGGHTDTPVVLLRSVTTIWLTGVTLLQKFCGHRLYKVVVSLVQFANDGSSAGRG
jgi:hypothetical protein